MYLKNKSLKIRQPKKTRFFLMPPPLLFLLYLHTATVVEGLSFVYFSEGPALKKVNFLKYNTLR